MQEKNNKNQSDQSSNESKNIVHIKNLSQIKTIDSSASNILRVLIPVILSSLSISLMFLIDRFFLAGYSVDSMNAACISGNFVAMLALFFIGISGSASVFVGQYNGSKQYDKLAAPVWQMIYFSIASIPFFLLLAYFSPYINMLPDYFLKDGLIYQQTLLYFAFLSPLRVSFATFFVGQGKTKIIAISAFTGASINIILDYILIYGIKGIVPSLGCKGAAIATNISEFTQVAILASIFFASRKSINILESRKIDLDLFKGCYRIGFPMSIGNFVIMLAWYMLQTIVGYTSKEAATVYNTALNFFMFFFFISGGAGRAATAICSNMIGREDLKAVKETYKFFIIMSLCLGAIIAIPLILLPNLIFNLLDFLSSDISVLYPQIRIALFCVSIAITLETLVRSTFGILVAGGDIKYGISVDMGCLWIFVVLPTAMLSTIKMLNSSEIIFGFMILRSVISFFMMYKRYKSMKWYNKLV